MTDSTVITVGPSAVATAEELKAHLRLNTDAEDDLLPAFLSAAQRQFEQDTDGRTVLTTTYVQRLTGWGDGIRLSRCPVQSVTGVTYHDADDVEQTLEGWRLDASGTPALVYLPDGDYPALSVTYPRPITVTFVAGWTDVPPEVKRAILQLAAHYYRVRHSHADVEFREVACGWSWVCAQYRTGMGGF